VKYSRTGAVINSKRIAFVGELLATGVCSCAMACDGSGNSFSPPPVLRVSVAPSTATTVPVGASARLVGTVSNDASNAGVSWTISCSAARCGTISPATTTSGIPVIYTAPAAMLANTNVTVTATAVTDQSKSATATLIPVGHIAGYDVGVDYHAYGDSLDTSAFINEYNQPQCARPCKRNCRREKFFLDIPFYRSGIPAWASPLCRSLPRRQNSS
jgi:hypothetical protein